MQLVEFGLGLDSLYDQAAVKRKIGEVDAQFDLVMIAERFDESMVLMADLLCWDLADVVNLKSFHLFHIIMNIFFNSSRLLSEISHKKHSSDWSTALIFSCLSSATASIRG